MKGNINATKLRSRMVEVGVNMSELSSKIGIDPSSMSRKINGYNDFTVGEMQSIVDALRMSNADALDIFLPTSSH